MGRILGQAGISLPDIYDVKASEAPNVRELILGDVATFHEMGSTIFSERLSTSIRTFTTGAINQNTNWDIEITDLPMAVSRLLAIQVIVDAVRVRMATISVRDPILNLECPIWMWDDTVDILMPVRIRNAGAAADVNLMVPTQNSQNGMPLILAGTSQIQRVPDMAFRGDTTGFGAGTVTVTMILYSARAQLGGVSSFGLPVPSW